MLHRFVDTIRQACHLSGFQAYYGHLPRGPVSPTADEARKDYTQIFHGNLYHSF